MRRNDKEITDNNTIEEILKDAEVCRIALSDNNQPYIVPVNFGYRDKTLFFHSAPAGRKLDIIRRNNRVCFEVETGYELVTADSPCDFTARYRSVIGFGRAEIIEDKTEKLQALNVIMDHYTDTHEDCEYNRKQVDSIAVVKIAVENVTGKQSRFNN